MFSSLGRSFPPAFVAGPLAAMAAALVTTACATKEIPSLSSSSPSSTDAGPDSAPPKDAAAPKTREDAGSTLPDGAPTIDCVKAGGGARRDAAFLPGIFTAHIDLDEFCATFGCPYRSVQDFLGAYSCSPIEAGYATDMPRSVGCGLEVIGGISIFGGTEYFYDASTGKLVGAMIGSDSSFGPCNTGAYLAGTQPGTCDKETSYDCRAIP